MRGLAVVGRKGRGSLPPTAVNAGRPHGALAPKSRPGWNQLSTKHVRRPPAVGRDDARLMPRSVVTAGRTDCARQARRGSARANRSSSY